MFEGPVTGNIPEVLDNGEVTDGTHVTAGQLALALTPYAQVTDLAVNTAASGNNAAAIQSLDDRVTAELASKLDSSALAPAIAPLATAAALATTDGQRWPRTLQSSLTTGLSNKADQSAFDVLEGVVATKSTPDGVDLQLQHHGGHERLHRLGQQRHAGHGGRQLRPQDGGGPAELRGRLLLHVLGRAVHRLVGPRVVGPGRPLKVVAPLPALARHPRGQVLLQRLDAPVHHGNGVAVLGPLRAVHGFLGSSRSSVANSLPRSVVTTKFLSSPISCAARLVARPTPG